VREQDYVREQDIRRDGQGVGLSNNRYGALMEHDQPLLDNQPRLTPVMGFVYKLFGRWWDQDCNLISNAGGKYFYEENLTTRGSVSLKQPGKSRLLSSKPVTIHGSEEHEFTCVNSSSHKDLGRVVVRRGSEKTQPTVVVRVEEEDSVVGVLNGPIRRVYRGRHRKLSKPRNFKRRHFGGSKAELNGSHGEYTMDDGRSNLPEFNNLFRNFITSPDFMILLDAPQNQQIQRDYDVLTVIDNALLWVSTQNFLTHNPSFQTLLPDTYLWLQDRETYMIYQLCAVFRNNHRLENLIDTHGSCVGVFVSAICNENGEYVHYYYLPYDLMMQWLGNFPAPISRPSPEFNQLNGNNGEATNTDDIDVVKDDPTKANILRGVLGIPQKQLDILARGEVIDNVVNKPKPKKKVDKKCKYWPNCAYKDCIFQHPTEVDRETLDPLGKIAPPVEEESDLQVKYVLMNFSETTFYGGSFSNSIPHDTKKYTFKPVKFVVGNPTEGGYDIGDNYFLYESESNAFEGRLYFPTFVSFSRTFTINSFIDYSPLVVKLTKIALGRLPHTDLNYTAIHRYMYKNYTGFIPDKYIEGSMIAFCYDMRFGGANPTSEYEISQIAMTTTSHLTCGEGSRKINPVICELKKKWMFNGRWRVLNSNGFQFNYNKNSGMIAVYPNFHTPIGERARFNVSMYARFIGFSPSVYYEVCGENFSAASSRMFKCRTDSLPVEYGIRNENDRDYENDLYAAQCKLVAVDPSVLEVCGAVETPVGEHGDKEILFRDKGKIIYKPIDPHTLNKIRERTNILLGGIGVFHRMYNYLLRNGYEVYDYVKKCSLATLGGLEFLTKYSGFIIYSTVYNLYPWSSWLSEVVELPAPKRPLYRTWYETKYKFIVDNFFKWESKLKKEPAKSGKASRLYASANWNTLYDRVVSDLLKKMHAKVFNIGDKSVFNIQFNNAASRRDSDKMYSQLRDVKLYEVKFVYYGDDGFLVYRSAPDQLEIYETDIESCDASTGIGVFAVTYSRLKKLLDLERAKGVIGQCMYPFRFNNPNNEQEFVEATPQSFFVYSGWFLTTIAACEASEVSAHGIREEFEESGDILRSIYKGPRKYGYVLTCERQSSLNQVTFLKRAYNGAVSWVVYGTIFRSLGIVEGGETNDSFGWDYSTYMASEPEARLKRLVRVRMEGLTDEPGSIIINALRTYCGLPMRDLEVSVEDIMDRYGGDEWMYTTLVSDILEMRVGSIISNDAIKLILRKDYGYVRV
jgi:hypothetical protein